MMEQPVWLIALQYAAAVITSIGLLYGIFKGFIKIIDDRIERKISQEAYIKRITSLIRATVIFDENESIVYDQGGMQFLESVRVEHGESNIPNQIIVTPRQFLSYPPLLQILDSEGVDIECVRGTGLTWIYNLDYFMTAGNYNGKRRFRLEVL